MNDQDTIPRPGDRAAEPVGDIAAAIQINAAGDRAAVAAGTGDHARVDDGRPGTVGEDADPLAGNRAAGRVGDITAGTQPNAVIVCPGDEARVDDGRTGPIGMDAESVAGNRAARSVGDTAAVQKIDANVGGIAYDARVRQESRDQQRPGAVHQTPVSHRARGGQRAVVGDRVAGADGVGRQRPGGTGIDGDLGEIDVPRSQSGQCAHRGAGRQFQRAGHAAADAVAAIRDARKHRAGIDDQPVRIAGREQDQIRPPSNRAGVLHGRCYARRADNGIRAGECDGSRICQKPRERQRPGAGHQAIVGQCARIGQRAGIGQHVTGRQRVGPG